MPISALRDARARVRLLIKWMIFPGLDLHTRSRYRLLPQFFLKGRAKTLDAGCGNGALAYAAYRRGNDVLGVTNDAAQVQRAKALFYSFGADPQRMKFEILNLCDLDKLKIKFDQIICSETLEHIRDDKKIISSFFGLLNEGGVLHLCCPNADHPSHRLGRVDAPEDGGHVRDGYTLESYRNLLEPAGFSIDTGFGIGSSVLEILDRPARALRHRFGDWAAFPFFILCYHCISLFDGFNPAMPFSIYVRAVKKVGVG
jgi:SAM-dependent methyltransferase